MRCVANAMLAAPDLSLDTSTQTELFWSAGWSSSAIMELEGCQ